MKISVIIPTLNRPEDLHKALDSIAKQTLLPAEVILVDQSEDLRTKMLAQAYEEKLNGKVHLVYVREVEKSSVKARNRGINLAAGDILCFIDDDVELFSDYCEQVESYFEKHPAVGGLSGSDEADHSPADWRWKLRKVLNGIFLLNHHDGRPTISGFGYPIYERSIDKPIDVEMLPGCNMNFRRSVIGNERLDEWFTGYSFREDAEFSYRLSKKTKLMMIPGAKLYHNYSPVNRQGLEEKRIMEFVNCRYVAQKIKGKGLSQTLLFYYSILGILFLSMIEALSRRTGGKWKQFLADMKASAILLGVVKLK